MKRQSGPFMTIIFACAAALAAMVVPAHAPLAQGQPIRLVALGDSLTAGYGLPQEAAFPVVLERALKAKGYNVEVANAGVSGDTASAGLDRLDWSVPDGTDGVIVELGANDALRGAAVETIRANLIAIVSAVHKAGARALLLGMRIPPNYGPVYTRRFEAVFAEVARQQNASLVPFMLQGFAEKRDLFQADGIHPNEDAQAKLLDNVWPTLRPMLD